MSLLQAFGEGQRRWPGIALPIERYVESWIQHHQDALPDTLALASDFYLATACVLGNSRASAAFQEMGSRVAQLAVSRIDRDPEFMHEVLQDLWEKLLVGPEARIREYTGRGPLMAWLRVAASRVALDRKRALRTVARRVAPLSESIALSEMSPESVLTSARYSKVFQKAVDDAMAKLSNRDQNLLRMHVKGHCSIDQIGRAYGVHRATAARWLERIRASVLASVRSALELGPTSLTDSEFRSVARQLGDCVEVVIASEDPGSHRGQVESPSGEAE